MFKNKKKRIEENENEIDFGEGTVEESTDSAEEGTGDAEDSISIDEDDIEIDEDDISLEDDEDEEDEGESSREQDGPVSKELTLYVLSDKKIKGLYDRLYDNGINVKSIMYKIRDINRELLINSKRVRLVIIDTGTGKFSNTAARKELADTIGILGDSNRITFMYTDDLIHESMKDSLSKRTFRCIEWGKYRSTIEVVDKIKGYKETYIGTKREQPIEKGIDIDRKMQPNLPDVSTQTFKYTALILSKGICYDGDNILEYDKKCEY